MTVHTAERSIGWDGVQRSCAEDGAAGHDGRRYHDDRSENRKHEPNSGNEPEFHTEPRKVLAIVVMNYFSKVA